jgi:hypothetical protein
MRSVLCFMLRSPLAECWSNGVVEYWSDDGPKNHYTIIAILQYSNFD